MMLDTRHQRWPGGNLPPNVPYQFVEGEYMKAGEYDLFLSDPSDFTLRYYLPRLFGVLAPVSRLPPLRTLSSGGFPAIVSLFATPEFRQLGEILYNAGQEQAKAQLISKGHEEDLNRLGFPSLKLGGGVGAAPFDTIADNLRGMRGSMLDMYRCPDKLLAACDKILQWRIAGGTPAKTLQSGKAPLVSRPLHKGAEGFMSLKQFEKFINTLRQPSSRILSWAIFPGWAGRERWTPAWSISWSFPGGRSSAGLSIPIWRGPRPCWAITSALPAMSRFPCFAAALPGKSMSIVKT
jgi:hypothetical protein